MRLARLALATLASLSSVSSATASTTIDEFVTTCTLHTDIAYYPLASCELVAPLLCLPGLGSTNCLDVRLPAEVLPGSPTILFVHGGGWADGDKNAPGSTTFLDRLCTFGYRVVSCNYALACDSVLTPLLDGPAFPQAVVDVRAAIGWIRTRGQEPPYSLSDCIVLVGASAGAHIAAMVGALGSDPLVFAPLVYAGVDLAPRLTIAFSADYDPFRRGCQGGSCACTSGTCAGHSCVHPSQFPGNTAYEQFVGHAWLDGLYSAFACPSGAWDYASLAPGVLTLDPFLDSSPTHWLNATSSAFYLIHSTCDAFFPAEETTWMMEACALHGVPVARDLASCGHGLRIYGETGSADRVDRIIRIWNGYTHCE